MIVINDASSHQTSISKRPNVAAIEVPKATMIAKLINVIMPGLRSASSPRAPRMNTRPPYPKTMVPRMAGITFEPGEDGAEYPSQCCTSLDQKTTGIVRAKLSQNLSRNIATECPAWRSWLPCISDILWAAGELDAGPRSFAFVWRTTVAFGSDVMDSQYHLGELPSTGTTVQRATEMCRLSEEKCTTLRSSIPCVVLDISSQQRSDLR